MTVYSRARQIAKDGMIKEQVFEFIDSTEKNIVNYITLFGEFGIDQDIVWDLFEEWQERESEYDAQEQKRINK